MYAMLDSVISRRREGGEIRNDFLQTLLRKHTKDGADDDGSNADKLTDSQLKDNILTLLVAGHDTTTAGLTWLIKFLGENPRVLQKLRVSRTLAFLFRLFQLQLQLLWSVTINVLFVGRASGD